MLRQYDFKCISCEGVHTDLVEVPHGEAPPKHAELECPACEANTQHERQLSAPALYTYDRPYMPWCAGGKYDTQGYRTPPRLPTIPDGAPFDHVRDILRSDNYRTKLAERMDVIQQNKAKQARAQAIAKGANIDLRTNPLPGDPPAERIAARAKRVG